MNDPITPIPDPNRVFDISPPNKTAPSPTSRPLVNNQPTQPDPMMRPTSDIPAETSPPSTPPIENPSQPVAAQEIPENTTPSVSLPVTEPSSDEPQHQEFSQTVSSIASIVPESEHTGEVSPQPQVMSSAAVVVRHRFSRPSSRTVMTVVLALLLIVAAIDVLLDDQIIKINSAPHTHFFQK